MNRILTHIEQVLKAEASKNDPRLPATQIPLTDQQRILRTDIREILADRTVIFDDRKRLPR